MKQFLIKSYPFGELAQMYYPDHGYDSALRLFRREMHETRGMWQAMQDVDYKENTKVLTRAQVKVTVKFLGRTVAQTLDFFITIFHWVRSAVEQGAYVTAYQGL